MPKGHIPDDDVVLEAVERLLDIVLEVVTNRDEWDYLCKVCNEVGGHAGDCFVPAVKAWQEAK